MNELSQKTRPKPGIPPDVLERWQSILDAFAGVTGVSAALITRADPVSLEVLVSSRAFGGSAQPDETCEPDLTGYCARVMRQRTRLLVTGTPGGAGEDQPSPPVPESAYSLGYPLMLMGSHLEL